MLVTWWPTPSCRGSGCGRKSGSSCGHTSISVHFSSNAFQCSFSWALQCGFRTIHTHNAPVAEETAFYDFHAKARQTLLYLSIHNGNWWGSRKYVCLTFISIFKYIIHPSLHSNVSLFYAFFISVNIVILKKRDNVKDMDVDGGLKWILKNDS